MEELKNEAIKRVSQTGSLGGGGEKKMETKTFSVTVSSNAEKIGIRPNFSRVPMEIEYKDCFHNFSMLDDLNVRNVFQCLNSPGPFPGKSSPSPGATRTASRPGRKSRR